MQDTFDHDKGQKSAISGSFLNWIFLISSSGFFSFFSRFSLCFWLGGFEDLLETYNTSLAVGASTAIRAAIYLAINPLLTARFPPLTAPVLPLTARFRRLQT